MQMLNIVTFLATVIAVWLLPEWAAGAPPQIVPVEGAPFAAELSAAGDDWQWTFRHEDKTQTLAAADVVRWGMPADVRRGPVLVLSDGGLLVAEVLGADKEKLTADSEFFGAVKLPWESLAGIVFRLPGTPAERDALIDQIATAQGDKDRVLLVNGDRIAGRVESLSEDALRVETEVGLAPVELHRVQAVVLNPALWRRVSPQGLHAVLGFGDGSRLAAQRMHLDKNSLNFTSADGTAWKTIADRLVLAEPRGGKAVYLSDLSATSYRHVPFLELNWPYRCDRAVSGPMLRAGGAPCLKGLGMHSASRLTYNLEKPCRLFQAELAVDDSAEGGGSVRFRVFVDGKEKFTSPAVRGGQTPIPMSVDIAGAKRLDLVVDYADRADEMDRADWLAARLVPPNNR
jgi:hypothetical protein